MPPTTTLSSTTATRPAAPARATRSSLTGRAHTGSTTRTRTPSAVSFSAAASAVAAIEPMPTRSRSTSPSSGSASTSTVPDVRTATTGSATDALGEADDRRRVGDVDGGPHGARDLLAVARGGEVQPGHDAADRHVPHAVVRGAVGAGDARPVEHEGDAGPVHGAVHQQLVEGAVEEGGVDRDDGVQPGERQPGRHGDGVLLGDADVEDAVGEAVAEALRARPGSASRR